MAEPLKTSYVRLDGVAMRSKGLESFDWADLLKSAPLRGEDTVAPGVAGVEPGPRVRGHLRAFFRVRVSGAWNLSNAETPGGVEEMMERFYLNLGSLRNATNKTSLVEVAVVTPHATYSGDCYVEDPGSPSFLNPWTAEFAVDLTVPAGTLVIP